MSATIFSGQFGFTESEDEPGGWLFLTFRESISRMRKDTQMCWSTPEKDKLGLDRVRFIRLS